MQVCLRLLKAKLKHGISEAARCCCTRRSFGKKCNGRWDRTHIWIQPAGSAISGRVGACPRETGRVSFYTHRSQLSLKASSKEIDLWGICLSHVTFECEQPAFGRRPTGCGEPADAIARDHAMAGNDDRKSVRLHRRSNRSSCVGKARLGSQSSIRNSGTIWNLPTLPQDTALKFSASRVADLYFGERNFFSR